MADIEPLSMGLSHSPVRRKTTKADRTQGNYSNPPIIVAFTIDIPGTPNQSTIAPGNFLLLKR